jgi:hypothetical protein
MEGVFLSEFPLILCIFCAFAFYKILIKITMKKVLFFVLFLACLSNVFAQTTPPVQKNSFDLSNYGVKIEPDKRLIVVMAALEMAGIELPMNEKGKEFRNKIHEDLKGVDANLLQKMQLFLSNYKKKHSNLNSAEFIAPFISLAYSVTPVPALNEPARTTDLPADLLEVLDFAPFVREFYQVSGIQTKLPEYVQLYQAEGDKMNVSATLMINAMTDYLHTTPQLVVIERVRKPDPKNKKQELITTVEHERRFYIVPDLLASTGTVNFRNIGDDYYVIVPPNTNLRTSEARRAYLQFVLDPIILKYAKDITPFSAGIKQLLEERRKTGAEVSPDIYLAVLRSLVSAVDAREREYLRVQDATDEARRKIDFAKTVEGKKAVSADLAAQKQTFSDETAIDLSEAYERGAVLAFYFSNQLKGLEDSGFDLSSSLRDIILSIDTTKESNRLAQFADARKRGLLAREERKKKAVENATTNKVAVERSRALKAKLEGIEVLTKNNQFEEAESRLKGLLDEYPGEPSIYYALGRVSSLYAGKTFDEGLRDKRLENAKLHYNNAIRSSNVDTDPALVQICYVALGRINEFYEENNFAIQNYEKALMFKQANVTAYNEAVIAINRLTAAPKKP